MAIKNVVATNSYIIINIKEIGHGGFFILNNGNIYSNSNKEHNSFNNGLVKLVVGDVIRV